MTSTSIARSAPLSLSFSLCLSLAVAACASGPDDTPGDDLDDVTAAVGSEQIYGENMRRCLGIALNKPIPASWQETAGWTLQRPGDGTFTGGTPNHKLLQRVWYYCWANVTGQEVMEAQARLMTDIFDNQLTNGHYAIGNASEVLTVSHYQLWVQGVAAARLVARRYGDATVLAATGRWMRAEKSLWDLLARGGVIDAPGARFKDGQAQNSQLRDVNYLQYKNQPVSKSAAWFDDKYNAGAWMLRELRQSGDDLGGAATAVAGDRPALRNPLCVCTAGSDFVYAFPQMDGALEPIFFVYKIGGDPVKYGPYNTGTPVFSTTPPPRLAGATLKVVPGRLGGSCTDGSGVPICAAP